jgi:hypothetical protein
VARYSRRDWTGSDYSTLRDDALALIARIAPDFTKTNPADPGMVAFELVCFIGDLIRYYQDRQFNEAFLITSIERANIIRHLKMIGYLLSTAAPASTSLTFTLAKAYSSSVTFPQGAKITTEDGVVAGELVDKLEVAAGSTSGAVDWIEGETVVADLGESDGSASQKFVLAQSGDPQGFIGESETIVVDGIVWTRVDDFLSSDSAAQVYVVDVDAFDQATVIFGDGVNGAVPADGALITATYRIGGGELGNVEADTLKKYVGSVTAADGTTVSFSVTNPAKASGGANKESNAHAKLYGPRSLATNGRAVTTADYQTIAEKVPGVARALAQTSNEDPAIAENTVHVQIVPTGSGTPSQLLLDTVEAALKSVKPNTTRLRVLPAVYIDVALVGTVYLRHPKSGQAIQASAIETEADAILRSKATAAAAGGAAGAVDLYFDAEHIDVEEGDHTIGFGTLIPLSDLLGVPRDAGTLRKYVDLTSPATDLAVSAKLFPRLRAYAKAVLTGPDRVEFTWTGLGTKLVVREEP